MYCIHIFTVLQLYNCIMQMHVLCVHNIFVKRTQSRGITYLCAHAKVLDKHTCIVRKLLIVLNAIFYFHYILLKSIIILSIKFLTVVEID